MNDDASLTGARTARFLVGTIAAGGVDILILLETACADGDGGILPSKAARRIWRVRRASVQVTAQDRSWCALNASQRWERARYSDAKLRRASSCPDDYEWASVKLPWEPGTGHTFCAHNTMTSSLVTARDA